MVFWIHLILIIILWLSPLWADWILILIGIISLHIYWAIFQGCHLTKMETGKDKDMTFYYHHLSRYFPSLEKRKVKMVVRVLIPATLLLIALILQEVLGWKPVLGF
jgi:hypothetical protein